MIVAIRLTPGLAAMLRTRQDDGTPELLVRYLAHRPTHTRILRSDGSELSDTECMHVRATLAAHAVEPL